LPRRRSFPARPQRANDLFTGIVLSADEAVSGFYFTETFFE
jgi:hypothetical protein